MGNKAISEIGISRLWLGMGGKRLLTVKGEAIEVICPGRWVRGKGPDFRHAILLPGQRDPVTGDVEVHVRSKDWLAHCHHHDPSYNRVILHVVYQDDLGDKTSLRNGERVPTLAFEGQECRPLAFEAGKRNPLLQTPCGQRAREMGLEGVGGYLDVAGEERFLEKSLRFQEAIGQDGAEEALYQGLMVALGYSRNKAPFLELARRLPLRQLEAVSREKPRDDLQETWERMLVEAAAPFSPAGDLHWCVEVRPGNLPRSRLTAASYLLFRYLEQGLLGGLMTLLERSPLERGSRWLEGGIMVSDKARACLGADRAREIVVNVLLPFTFAWGNRAGYPGLRRKALDLYRRYPGMKANAISLHMEGFLLSWVAREKRRTFMSSARRHQGLLHIYGCFCSQGRCAARLGFLDRAKLG